MTENQENLVKQIADKLNCARHIDIETRIITEDDITRLNNDEILRVQHEKGFNIMVRKEYKVDMLRDNPTLLYGINYIVADEIMGKHDVVFNAKDMADYINNLLGFYDDVDDEEL